MFERSRSLSASLFSVLIRAENRPTVATLSPADRVLVLEKLDMGKKIKSRN